MLQLEVGNMQCGCPACSMFLEAERRVAHKDQLFPCCASCLIGPLLFAHKPSICSAPNDTFIHV